MSIQIKVEPKLHDKYVAFTLTNPRGKAEYCGIRPYSQLFQHEEYELSEPLYMNIVLSDSDRLNLYQEFETYCQLKHPHLLKQLKRIKNKWLWGYNCNKSKVICVDTGEHFESIKEVSRVTGANYNQLLRHLNGEKSYKTVQGKVYKKLDTLEEEQD